MSAAAQFLRRWWHFLLLVGAVACIIIVSRPRPWVDGTEYRTSDRPSKPSIEMPAQPPPTATSAPVAPATTAPPIVIGQPVRIQIPALGIDEPLEPQAPVPGQQPGQFILSPPKGKITWFEYAGFSAPGNGIVSLLAGHVTNTLGAVLGNNRSTIDDDLPVGETVVIVDELGHRLVYVIAECAIGDVNCMVPKNDVPLDVLRAHQGMWIVTCGTDDLEESGPYAGHRKYNRFFRLMLLRVE